MSDALKKTVAHLLGGVSRNSRCHSVGNDVSNAGANGEQYHGNAPKHDGFDGAGWHHVVKNVTEHVGDQKLHQRCRYLDGKVQSYEPFHCC